MSCENCYDQVANKDKAEGDLACKKVGAECVIPKLDADSSSALIARGYLIDAGDILGPQAILDFCYADDVIIEIIIFIEGYLKKREALKRKAAQKANNGEHKT